MSLSERHLGGVFLFSPKHRGDLDFLLVGQLELCVSNERETTGLSCPTGVSGKSPGQHPCLYPHSRLRIDFKLSLSHGSAKR